MSTTISDAFRTLGDAEFKNFVPAIAVRIEDAIFRSVAERMRQDIAAGKNASVTLPWGTYTADAKAAGEAGNITPAWTPSKVFLKLINGDEVSRDLYQDKYDPEYMKLFTTYAAYGQFTVNSDMPIQERGLQVTDDEAQHLHNMFLQAMVNVVREKTRPGSIYVLEINEAFPHGKFNFDYDKGGDIKVTFVPEKVFKQYLKDDEIATRAREGDFLAASAAAQCRVIRLKRRKNRVPANFIR